MAYGKDVKGKVGHRRWSVREDNSYETSQKPKVTFIKVTGTVPTLRTLSNFLSIPKIPDRNRKLLSFFRNIIN